MQRTEAFNCWLAHLTTILRYSGLLQNEGERDNKSASALRAGDQAKRYDSDPLTTGEIQVLQSTSANPTEESFEPPELHDTVPFAFS